MRVRRRERRRSAVIGNGVVVARTGTRPVSAIGEANSGTHESAFRRSSAAIERTSALRGHQVRAMHAKWRKAVPDGLHGGLDSQCRSRGAQAACVSSSADDAAKLSASRTRSRSTEPLGGLVRTAALKVGPASQCGAPCSGPWSWLGAAAATGAAASVCSCSPASPWCPVVECDADISSACPGSACAGRSTNGTRRKPSTSRGSTSSFPRPCCRVSDSLTGTTLETAWKSGEAVCPLSHH
ncbi:hypothetical protein FHU35_111214 [Saccharopolyspora dendranthemae]|uniref:Uncharacterized protein n=1 Tax=Saccharopolyspora dendranthemae TaxID=1181886 RepID=A0A561VAE3_9PSEU|nr:hypothetical protein FHU35_111214 [Saccharopolyspora dendranthemae]